MNGVLIMGVSMSLFGLVLKKKRARSANSLIVGGALIASLAILVRVMGWAD